MRKFSVKAARETIKRIFQRRKLLLVLLALSTLAGVVVAKIYWSRQATYSFSVIGIEAGLLQPDIAGYRSQIEVITLSANKKIGISIFRENFYSLWLNITWSSNAVGLGVAATGTYYYFVDPGTGWTMSPSGDLANALGYNVVDKTKMLWGASYGYMLVITFAFDTEAVTSPGTYTVNLLFQLGFV